MPAPLLERYREAARHVRFGPDDAESLRRFHEVAVGQLEAIAKDFSERLRLHPEALALLADEAQARRLERAFVAWMTRVCTGARDEEYCRESARIGAAHVSVGLPQRFVFSTMTLVRLAFNRIVTENFPDSADLMRASIHRALDLELAII